MRMGYAMRQEAAGDAAMKAAYGQALPAYRKARALLGDRLGAETAERLARGDDVAATMAWLAEQNRVGEVILDAWARALG